MKIGYMNNALGDPKLKLAETISQAIIEEMGTHNISKDEIASIIGKSTSFVYKVSQKRLSFDFDDLARIGAQTQIPVLEIVTNIYSQITNMAIEDQTANNEMIELGKEINHNLTEINSLEFQVSNLDQEQEKTVDWDSIINSKEADIEKVDKGIAVFMDALLKSPENEKINFLKIINENISLQNYLNPKHEHSSNNPAPETHQRRIS